MSTTVRGAIFGDEELLAVLNRIVRVPHVAKRPEYFKPARADNVFAWFRSLLQKPTVLIWIAEADGVAVGYVLAFLPERAENPFCPARKWCEIDQIAVDAKWRRRGIARALVQRILAEVRGRGIRAVEMSSWSFNETAPCISAARVCTRSHPFRTNFAGMKRDPRPTHRPTPQCSRPGARGARAPAADRVR